MNAKAQTIAAQPEPTKPKQVRRSPREQAKVPLLKRHGELTKRRRAALEKVSAQYDGEIAELSAALLALGHVFDREFEEVAEEDPGDE